MRHRSFERSTPDFADSWQGKLALAVLVVIGLVLLERTPLFETAELRLYDFLLDFRRDAPAQPAPITLITVTEADLQEHAMASVPDAMLSQVLERLMKDHPRVIGVDLYRDMPIGCDGHADLAATFQRHPEISVIKFTGGNSMAAVKPPPSVTDAERMACSDVPPDLDQSLRRALLYVADADQQMCPSLGLQVALKHLTAAGVQPDPASDGPLMLNGTTLEPFREYRGGYVQDTEGGYQILPDFRRPAADFQRYQLRNIIGDCELRGDCIPASSIEGRIVLIGTDAESVKDHFVVPRSGRIAGVTFHAMVADQVLRAALAGEAPIRVIPDASQLGWLLLCCGCGFAAGIADMPLILLLVILSAGSLLNGAVAYAALGTRIWLPIVPAEVGFLLSAGLQGLLRARLEARVRHMLWQLFGRHVDPRIEAEIWRNRKALLTGGKLDARRLTATILFSDLAGFTTTAEAREPETFIAWINDYLAAMMPLIAAHDGVTIRVFGDAILAGFGVPVPRNDSGQVAADACRAVRCALAMAAELERLNQSWQGRGLPRAGQRIGLATGEIVAGSLGSAERLDYTVHGDVVNVAKRLEEWDKAGFLAESVAGNGSRILISAETARQIEGVLDTRYRGSFMLKGRNRETAIYEVVAHSTGNGRTA